MIGYERWKEGIDYPTKLPSSAGIVENKVKSNQFLLASTANKTTRVQKKKVQIPSPLTAKQRKRMEEKRRSKLTKHHLAGKQFREQGRRSTGAYKRLPKVIQRDGEMKHYD